MNKIFTVSFLFFAIFANSFGQDAVDRCKEKALDAFNPIRGSIPLSFGQMPSTDLVCNLDTCLDGVKRGDILTPTQAGQLYDERSQATRCQWTLAELDPQELPEVWKNSLGEKLNLKSDELEVNDLDQVDYLSKGIIKLGSYRLTVNKTNRFGTPKQYTFILNKSVHNYLLRRNLLLKLGYQIPPIKYLKRVQVNFRSKKQKEKFIGELKSSGTGSLNRWVLNQTKKSVMLQDLVVMEDQEFRLNLAKGYISPDIFEGKRVYKSLLIPYALANIPESINMLDWTVGRILSENVKLNYPDAADYNITSDDAVWMIKRITKLTAQDWWEIVDQTHMPSPVKALLYEKMKSRRNHLAKLFSVDNVNLPVDAYISNGEELIDGKLQKEFFEGYARRFKIPDPESPLSYSEMVSFIKSKAMSTGIDLLVNAFNSQEFMGTNISNKVQEFNEKILAEAVAESVTEGSVTKTPVKAFAFPTASGSIIVNREIVAGSYLGTDNMIQLVDTVGASVSAGVFGGITGIYSKTGDIVTTASGVVRQQVPVDLSANSKVYYNRTYAHIRPIDTVQKALKYPFKNLFVPYLKRKYGHYIDELMDSSYEELTIDEKIKVNKTFTKTLTSILKSKEKEVKKKKFSKEEAIIKEKALASINAAQSYLTENKEKFNNIVFMEEFVNEFFVNIKKSSMWNDDWYSISEYCKAFGGAVELVSGKESCNYGDGANFTRVSSIMNQLKLDLDSIVQRHSWKLNHTDSKNEPDAVVQLLSDNLKVGESIIVTDSLGGSLGASAGLNLYNIFKVRLDINARKYVTGRLHFFRASENEIHVYRDLGNVNSIEASLGVNAFIPILKLTVRGSKGNGRTKFYKLNIGKIEDEFYKTKNKNRVKNLKAIQKVLFSGSTRTLDDIQKPVVIRHKFKESNNKLGVLVWRWNRLNQADKIKVELPSGDSKELYKRVLGRTRGRDYENYFNDLVSFFTSKILDTQFSATSFTSGNPGFTFMGRARNRVLSLEGIMENNRVEKPFVKLSHIVNGWKMKKDKVVKELRRIKKKYHFTFFEENVLAQTKELFLYNINVNFFVYDKGISHMLALSKDEVKKIWKRFQTRDSAMFTKDDALKVSGISRFFSLKRRYLKYKKKGDLDKATKLLLKMVAVVDDKLMAAGISRMYGGAKNFLALARLDGFRVGHENGDQVIFSNSLGRLGKYQTQGPLGQIRRFLGITNGEFSMSWLLGRVI